MQQKKKSLLIFCLSIYRHHHPVSICVFFVTESSQLQLIPSVVALTPLYILSDLPSPPPPTQLLLKI